MKKLLIIKWIVACDELVEAYKSGEILRECPLCCIINYHCQKCLWHIFQNSFCMSLTGMEYKPEGGRNYKARIKRLRRWKRKLNKMLKNGD